MNSWGFPHRNEWEAWFSISSFPWWPFPVRTRGVFLHAVRQNDSLQLNTLRGADTLDAKLPSAAFTLLENCKYLTVSSLHAVLLHACSAFVSTLLKYWYEQIIYEHKCWIVLFKILELCFTVFSALYLQRIYRSAEESCVGFLLKKRNSISQLKHFLGCSLCKNHPWETLGKNTSDFLSQMKILSKYWLVVILCLVLSCVLWI